ncbi:MAG: beta-ketoacyl synthase N-terminal-like domain-containing protein [Myxococcota bacterium]
MNLAITGVGVVSPLGVGRPAFEASLANPEAAREKAFGTPTVLDREKVGEAWAAEAWDFDAPSYLGKKGLRNFDRLTRFLVVAGKHALEDAGIKRDGEFVAYGPSRVGICSSTAYGSLDAITELNLVAELEDPRYINPSRFPNTVINAAAGYVSIWEDLRAPNVTVVDGNCGALDAVVTSETHLAHRRGDVFLVGGGEVLSEPLYLAFKKLGVVADREGEGFRFGEGAAYLVVERPEGAAGREATVLGTIAGYGTAFSPPASDAVLVHASSDSVVRAIRDALQDAGLERVDVVAAAVSGLAESDRCELEGIREVLGDVPVAAPKQILGESFGGAGALAMAAVLSWFSGAAVGPIVQGEAAEDVSTALVVTIGFYGNVSAVVLRK